MATAKLNITSKSILARTTTEALLKLFQAPHDVHEMAEILGPTLDAAGTNRLKKGIWARLKKDPRYKARPSGEAIRRRKVGRPRRNLPARTHPGENAVDKWKIVELKIAGKSTSEIARELNRSYPSIYLALRGMGFPDGDHVAPYYSFGEGFDRATLRHLHKLSGLSVTEFAKQLRIPFATLWLHSRSKKSRQLRFSTAQKAAEWRRGLFRHLMGDAHPRRGYRSDRFGHARVIRTFFPSLQERYLFLLQVLRRLRDVLLENQDWSVKDLQNYLCAQAMLEKAGMTRGALFMRFLPWAPELMPVLVSCLDQVRSGHNQRLAWELLARSLGTTAPVISSLLNPAQRRTVKPIPRNDMAWVIKNRAMSVAPPNNGKQPRVKAEARNVGGRPEGMSKETKQDAELLLQHMAEFENRHGTKKGAVSFASLKVYGAVNERKRVERARKTINRYKKELGTKT
jgi:hypothetical protein